jgi:hypothetical protein
MNSPEILNFIKIRPVEAELFHSNSPMTKLIVTFRNFAKAPNKGQVISVHTTKTCGGMAPFIFNLGKTLKQINVFFVIHAAY